MLDGYLKSKSKGWRHIFKMSVKPGGEILLKDLFNSYGKKHNIEEKDFIKWLVDVKLSGQMDDWLLVEEPLLLEPEIEVKNTSEPIINPVDTPVNKLTVSDVVGLSVRQAREIVPRIQDGKLLKFALIELNPLPGKESLSRILRKRLNEIGSR